MTNRPGLDFSFSGLKTFALNTIQQLGGLDVMDAQMKADVACAFQSAMVDTLTIKCRRALKATGLKNLVIAGGVGANQALRKHLGEMCNAQGIALHFPSPAFCTDNGAMIAYAGCQRLVAGEQDDDFSATILPRWSLDQINLRKL